MGALNLDPLEKALTSLKEGIEASRKRPADDLARDGVIQRFEYTMDLCWKLLQRYLKEIAQMDESVLRTKKDLFREGAKRGLLGKAEDWIAYYEARNETSHTYNARIAGAVYGKAVAFPADAERLLSELRKC